MSELVNAFGRNLRRLRTQKGISQKDVADAVGVQQGFISNVEDGRRRPSLPMALAIAEFFNVTLDEMSRDHEPVAPVAADAA